MQPISFALYLTLLSSTAAAQVSAERFSTCLATLRAESAAKGVSTAAFDRLTSGLTPDPSVLEFLDYQPEFRTPIWDYLASLVDDERVADALAMREKWAGTLAASAERYQVDGDTVIAVWGVESNFGRNFGKRPLLTSLGTLACFGRRQAYFRGEFLSTLKILDRGDIAPDRLVGSWAGAFGHTQFMPSTFLRLAVDGDGDGKRDLMDSVPDALASTANFLHKAGWRQGEPWGYEVVLPAGFDTSVSGRGNKRPLSSWIGRGIRRADGQPIVTSDAAAGLLLPAGPRGPAFLVFRNFDAIYGYNAAESYALAIAHLADRIKGGKVFVTPWPTDDPGLSRSERRELQTLLAGRGYPIGEIDGMIGANSRQAILAEQKRLGLTVDGRPGQKLLAALRAVPAGR
ncbi:MAG: lytic murein transglycosylase [Candidatus Accumulibacter sp.]|uniref:Lytic murein transglycosylase n=2 Tax=Candidatus Accumulibacter TaxID=327159 RepID=A0A080M3S8_9PROT|nr:MULTISPECIES: lytic murein transglycosylase [Candidatus Accumulibacter]KFB75706.1 MAG: Membrane-bound lytic murein transglycosylase B precursor [Candidatus Accumulibacter cognatus]MBL8401821.1 lytic murein transglycosylase [Accumulibacter sp.]MBN8517297.1 lytic murein transglycosylase [Accumulibacter sp.]MBO3710551.1 lytic murein transglycosylase [Accumulibacter sp.]MCC2866746.1 lytic murein transglycosylase [Candidatus Accumulibacter phosphatis]